MTSCEGFLRKTNTSDIALEFGLRMSTDKFFGLGKTGNNLVDEIGIGFIKKKVVDDASQFKGKIGFGL